MHNLVTTNDGSNTLYSSKYQQYFHDINTGAVQEALSKHVIPAIAFHKNKSSLKILDICFGLGYNTFSTIYYVAREKLNINLEFYSPELDLDIISSLATFTYPKEFNDIKHIIQELSKTLTYKDKNISISIHIGNARKYIPTLENIDIVYQDPFSCNVNPELWSVEYFKDVYKICNQDVILSTYSVATKVRLSLSEAGFFIYEIKPIKKKQTLAFKQNTRIEAKYIDMELKKTRNTEATAIYDSSYDI